MTIALLFPPRDRLWLKSLISPHRRWSKWWELTPQHDRMLLEFDIQIRGTPEFETYRRPINSSADLFDVYPHWAVRLQEIYEEAQDPTPSSAVGKWAERRKGPRHTYWVTVVGFLLAILFGLAATILGVMQLWVSYCQWKVPEGGHGCG